jgi:hypothetical protein
VRLRAPFFQSAIRPAPVLEKLDLAVPFLHFLDCLIRASEILSLNENDLVSARNFLDHSDLPVC